MPWGSCYPPRRDVCKGWHGSSTGDYIIPNTRPPSLRGGTTGGSGTSGHSSGAADLQSAAPPMIRESKLELSQPLPSLSPVDVLSDVVELVVFSPGPIGPDGGSLKYRSITLFDPFVPSSATDAVSGAVKESAHPVSDSPPAPTIVAMPTQTTNRLIFDMSDTSCCHKVSARVDRDAIKCYAFARMALRVRGPAPELRRRRPGTFLPVVIGSDVENLSSSTYPPRRHEKQSTMPSFRGGLQGGVAWKPNTVIHRTVRPSQTTHGSPIGVGHDAGFRRGSLSA